MPAWTCPVQLEKVPKKKIAKEIQDFTGAVEAYPRAVIITKKEMFSGVEKGYFNTLRFVSTQKSCSSLAESAVLLTLSLDMYSDYLVLR